MILAVKKGAFMYAIEFETHIEDGIVRVPKKYSSLQSSDAKIIILAMEPNNTKSFNPKDFFGKAKVSKEEIDTYLKASKNEWE